MVENRPWLTLFTHAVLLLGVAAVAFPLYVTFVASTLRLEEIMSVPMPLVPGDQFLANYSQVRAAGGTTGSKAPVATMLFNSTVMALAIAIGKIAISIIASFAIVYFRFPLRMFFFWMIFVTLMLPVEVRIIPTFKVVADLGMLDSYAGLTLPLIAPATAPFLFRPFFLRWNQYLLPLLITNQESMYTTVIGIRRMIVGGDAANEWHLIMATAM